MAKQLWQRVSRPNLMVKIPGTKEGLPAIEECIYEGLNINVTLIFSVDMYEKAARAYEDELRNHFGLRAGEFPRFDLMLLGLGDNSHTASLFPGSAAIHESERLALAVEVDDPTQRHRVTLTPPVINSAARVMFLAAGAGKAQAVWNILKGPRDIDKFPAQVVAPDNGEVIWLLDKAAAKLIA